MDALLGGLLRLAWVLWNPTLNSPWFYSLEVEVIPESYSALNPNLSRYLP